MAVERIEEYKQQNGAFILKVFTTPTKYFPKGGYFYAPAEAISLVQGRNWYLKWHNYNHIIVRGHDGEHNSVQFYRELFYFYNKYSWDGEIDHINLVEIDNTDANLNAVSRMQNGRNRTARGYTSSFQPRTAINSKVIYPCGYYQRYEDVACKQQHWVETVWLKEQLGSQYYMFDFKKCRRGSEDILDLERTGKISEEEAIYRHVSKYASNPWYILRYGLEDYCKQMGIYVPQYGIDRITGKMVDPITWKPLCPYC